MEREIQKKGGILKTVEEKEGSIIAAFKRTLEDGMPGEDGESEEYPWGIGVDGRLCEDAFGKAEEIMAKICEGGAYFSGSKRST